MIRASAAEIAAAQGRGNCEGWMTQAADNPDPPIQNTAPSGAPVHALVPAGHEHGRTPGPPGREPEHDHAHADDGHAHEHTGDPGHEHGDEQDHHDHEDDHDADDHDHDHDHAHGGGPLAAVLGLFGLGHGHSHGSVQVDSALEGS